MPRDDGWTLDAAIKVQARNAPSQASLPLGRGSAFQSPKAEPVPTTEHEKRTQNIPQNMHRLQPDAEGWVELVIVGDPLPKGRVRARLVKPKGKDPFIVMYTPKETEDYEKMVGALWTAAGGPYLGGRLELHCLFFQTPQKNGAPRHEDASNMGKSVEDGLNKIAYPDDRYIIRATFEKLEDKHNPRTVIRLRVAPDVR